MRHNYWAREPQLLKPVRLEPVLRNKRSHRNEKPAHRNKDPTQPKINKIKSLKKERERKKKEFSIADSLMNKDGYEF